MQKIEVKYNKYACVCFSTLAGAVFILFASLTYFLGWCVTFNGLAIYFSVIIAVVVILIAINIIYDKMCTKKYVITGDSVSLFKRNELVFEILRSDMIKLEYCPFIPLTYYGGGELTITFKSEKDYPKSVVKWNDTKIHAISMPKKTARSVSFILDIGLK